MDEPVEQPVGVERGVPSADGRQPGGEPAKRRAEAGGLHGERPLPRQVGKEHVPAQVHARPALVREVRQDGDVVGHRSPSPPTANDRTRRPLTSEPDRGQDQPDEEHTRRH